MMQALTVMLMMNLIVTVMIIVTMMPLTLVISDLIYHNFGSLYCFYLNFRGLF